MYESVLFRESNFHKTDMSFRKYYRTKESRLSRSIIKIKNWKCIGPEMKCIITSPDFIGIINSVESSKLFRMKLIKFFDTKDCRESL